MASAYLPQGARPDVQVLSQTTVQDVQIVAGLTSPSGIYYELPINLGTWERDQGLQAMTAVGGAIEDILTWDNIVGAIFTQDLDANGLLQNFMRFTVAVPGNGVTGGTFTGTFEVTTPTLYQPFSVWTPVVRAQVDGVLATLNAAINSAPLVSPPAATSPPATTQPPVPGTAPGS